MNRESYRQASDLEETNPGKALKIYDKLEHENLEFRKYILLFGIIGFSVGFIIAFFARQYIVSHKYIAPLAIWYGIGFITTFGLYYAARIKREPLTKSEVKKLKYQFLTVPVLAVLAPFLQLLELCLYIFITVVFAEIIFGILGFIYHIVSGVPFISPLLLPDMPIYIYFPVISISFIIVFLILVVFDASIPSKISVKLILRVMKLKMREVLSMLILFFSIILIFLGKYPANIFYDNFITGLVMSVIIGTVLGFAMAYIEKNHILGNLYRIAKSRCLIRMDRDFETNFLLKDVLLKPNPFTGGYLASTDQSIEYLAKTVSLIQERRELKQRKTLFMLLPGPRIWIRPHRIFEKDIMGAIDIVRTSICDNEYREILSDNIQRTENLAAKVIGEIKDKRAVEPLIQALKGEDAVGRRDAAWTLRKIGEPTVGPLIPVLRHEDWWVRKGAVWILGKIGEPAVVPLSQALKDKDERIRMNVAWALGEVKDKRAVEPLIQALNDKDEHVRMNAAWALGEIKDKRAVEPLIQALNDEYWDVRINSAVALGEIKDKRAVEPIQALKKEVWEAREVEVVALALKKIGESVV